MLSMDPPLARAEDLSIPRCVATADETIALPTSNICGNRG
jgi:hypothetical protein